MNFYNTKNKSDVGFEIQWSAIYAHLTMSNITLFLTSAIIWGTTWIMITFQLGEVEPMVSVVYRFFIACLILLGYCFLKKKAFKFTLQEHALILVQGLLLFGFNYWLTYIGITKINSALAAILSTSIVYMNVVFARIFLGDKIKPEVLIGATIGIIGIVLIFMPEVEFNNNNNDNNIWSGVAIVLAASIFASLGNIFSAKTQRKNIPIVQANTLGMGYAAILLTIIALLSGYSFNFEMSLSYLGSLLYLALFGSVIAFGAFLTLIGRVGPDKAGYVTLVYPVIAMIVSSIFEAYHWSLLGLFGLLIILLGNFIAMGKYKNLALYQKWRQARI
jgi:drug/metabolite transporter (DMT)-like permease